MSLPLSIGDLTYTEWYKLLYDSQQTQAYRDYIFVEKIPVAANGKNLLSPAQIREYLKLDSAHSESDDFLISLREMAVRIAEHCTRREINLKKFRTYSPCFFDKLVLKKSPLVEVTLVSYTNDAGDWTEVDPVNYYVTENSTYSELLLSPSGNWPNVVTTRGQAVKIEFTAGYADLSKVAEDMKSAILAHMSILYEQRGDWTNTEYAIGTMPSVSQQIYALNRITNR